ncbi:MAG: hypothetical protein R2838_11775 [Caldilineaceae bacterium]
MRTLVEQFDVAFSERGVLALRAQGRRFQPPQPVTETFATPQPFGPLALVGYARGDAVPGQELPVTLLWTSTAPVSTQYNTSLRLVRARRKRGGTAGRLTARHHPHHAHL